MVVFLVHIITILFVIIFPIYIFIARSKYDSNFWWSFGMCETVGLIGIAISTVILRVVFKFHVFWYWFMYSPVVLLPIIAVTLFNFAACAVNADRLRNNRELIREIRMITVNVVIAVLELPLWFVWEVYLVRLLR